MPVEVDRVLEATLDQLEPQVVALRESVLYLRSLVDLLAEDDDYHGDYW